MARPAGDGDEPKLDWSPPEPWRDGFQRSNRQTRGPGPANRRSTSTGSMEEISRQRDNLRALSDKLDRVLESRVSPGFRPRPSLSEPGPGCRRAK
ncbi:MAG: hypothetical protein OXH24_07775 [Cyanobacteria bacterium MAG IRC3_bin_20]|nr:hypothetical protein [Cyanobacteria bacterium MAG IRC3_bin_20]